MVARKPTRSTTWYRSCTTFAVAVVVTYFLWQRAETRGAGRSSPYRVNGGKNAGLGQLLGILSKSPRIRSYDLIISAGHAAPDGVRRPMLLINGEYPGPLIEGNVGDVVRVRVSNQLPPTTEEWDGAYRELFSSTVDEYLAPGIESHVSLHWHGLSMRGSPEMDGAPGFTSQPIAPGGVATYEFTLVEEDVGTHWYHSHVGMQRSDGLFGPLVVHPAGEVGPSKGIHDDQFLLLGDHYHTPGIDQLSWFMSRHSLGFEPTPDSVLINGRGVFNCSAALRPAVQENCDAAAGSYAEVALTPGKTSRLRLVNVGAVGHVTFSIDEHELKVTEADGTPIVPFTTTRLSIAPGQRYSALVDGKSDGGDQFWIRATMDPECFNVANPSLDYEGRAIGRYRDIGVEEATDLRLRDRFRLRPRDDGSLPMSTAWTPGSEGDDKVAAECHDVPMHLLRPLQLPVVLGDDADWLKTMVTITMPKLDKNALVPVSYMNRTTWTHNVKTPLLERFRSANLSALAHPAYPSDPYDGSFAGAKGLPYDPVTQMVIHSPVRVDSSSPAWVELIINNSDEAPHPFHLHGHKFVVLESSESTVGWGSYSPDRPGEGIEYGPVVRDTFSVPRRGYAKIAWRMDNPGVWALHCHVLVHMASGMAMAFVDQPELLKTVPAGVLG